MLDDTTSKTMHKGKEGGDPYSTQENEVRHWVKYSQPIENINKSPQSFLEMNRVQKEVFPSHKLQDHAYE